MKHMNMLVERGLVPITPANDSYASDDSEHQQNQAVIDIEEIDATLDDEEPDEYELLRREACAIHVIEWQMRQLEVAGKIGIGPPRSL
jgi:hypothetical protein